MNSIVLLAQVYKEGLTAAIFSKEDVISWVDKVIEELDEPPYEFLDISLMSSALIEDIKGKLNEFCNELDIDYVTRILLSIIYYKLSKEKITIEKAITLTARLLMNTGMCYEEEYQTLYYCDDAYELAVRGVHHSLKEVIKVFKISMKEYNGYIKEFRIVYKEVMGLEWND